MIFELEQAEDIPYNEAGLLFQYWDVLLRHTLKRNRLKLTSEFSIKIHLDEIYPKQSVDRVAYCSWKGRQIPLVLIEAAFDPVPSDSTHRDETKLAIIMAAALLQQMKLMRGKGAKVLSQLKVFGLLIGGPDFEVCSMFPVVNEITQDTFDIDFVFVTSRSELRYRMYLKPAEPQPAKSVTSSFRCRGRIPRICQVTENLQVHRSLS
jgi:hypothetical protein